MKIANSVSITIPVYNEEEVLADAVHSLLSTMESTGLRFEIILAENGSQDGTLKVAEQIAQTDSRVKVLHLPSPDYGRAMRQGFLSSSGEWIANFSIDFVDVNFLLKALSMQSCDAVLGSKYVANGYDRRPLARRLAGLMMSGFVRLLFWLPVSDTHGIMAFRREKITPLVQKCCFGNEIFDTELIVRAHRAGLTMREVPVHVEEVRASRLGSFARARRMLNQFVRLRIALLREGIW